MDKQRVTNTINNIKKKMNTKIIITYSIKLNIKIK